MLISADALLVAGIARARNWPHPLEQTACRRSPARTRTLEIKPSTHGRQARGSGPIIVTRTRPTPEGAVDPTMPAAPVTSHDRAKSLNQGRPLAADLTSKSATSKVPPTSRSKFSRAAPNTTLITALHSLGRPGRDPGRRVSKRASASISSTMSYLNASTDLRCSISNNVRATIEVLARGPQGHALWSQRPIDGR